MLGPGRTRRERKDVADLNSELRGQAQEVAALRGQVARLRTTLRALWTVVSHRLGLEDAELIQALEAVEAEEKNQREPSPLCSQCSRPIQENSAFCIYCGAKVEHRRLF